MTKYCPCCGYNFAKKDYKAASKKLLNRYNDKTRDLLVNTFNIASQIEVVDEVSVYQFLQGVSRVSEENVFEALKIYYKKKLHKQRKGLNYLRGIVFNMDKNEERFKELNEHTLGVVPDEFEDD